MLKKLMNGIQHIGIPTTKMTESIKFYEDLGFETAYAQEQPKVAFLKHGEMVFEIYEVLESKNEHGAIDHIAIDVSDIEATYELIKSRGFEIIEQEISFLMFWEKGVRFFTIEGPNQEKIEFNQRL